MLPAGNFLQDQKAKLIAGVEKVTGLRIMRRSDDVAVQAMAENRGVLPLNAGGHRAANKRKSLMAIEPAQLNDLSVQRETLLGERSLAKADAAHLFIDEGS